MALEIAPAAYVLDCWHWPLTARPPRLWSIVR